MSKKKDKPLIFNHKIKLFMYYCYILQKPSAESYLLAGYKANSPQSAASAGYELKERLDNHLELKEIVRQLSPFPELVAGMVRLDNEAKDPNLRFKIKSKLGQWSGAEDGIEAAVGAGISINILTGRAAVQVVGSGPGEIEAETLEAKQRKKDGKPQSFIK